MLSVYMRRFAGAVAVALAVAATGDLGAQSVTDQDSTDAWFVQFSGSVDTFRNQARAEGIAFSERFVFSRLFRGVSVNASGEAIGQIRRLGSVTAVFPVLPMALDPVEPISPDLAHALVMTGADLAQQSGLTGAGVKVGLIDTGIDYHHPDLGGGFGAGYRVVTGYDFVGDRYNAAGSGGDVIPHPDRDPDDCAGHGTHVAGIIGADGNPAAGGARGVAPGVTFAAYRVFGCEGSTHSDIMVAAMERALADGVDVVNMSIGSAFQTWPQYPTAVAADALVDAGVVVVTSAGNSGANGVYSTGAPGVGRKVIATASFENTHVNVANFIANPGGRVIGYTTLSGSGAPDPPPPPTSGTSPVIVYVGRGCVDGDLTAPGNQTDTYLADPAGKVALITRGVCSFNEKYARAAQAGAAGVIIENNVAGIFFGGFTTGLGIFGIGIAQADGTALKALTLPTATWTDVMIDVPNPTAGRISASSSYGLNAELETKPDIGAPGGFVRSTLPLEQGGYGTLSGTSMASPHVAGAVALLLEAKPATPPSVVRAILQNSADPALFQPGVIDLVHRQGAGMVDIDDAILADTLVTPGKLSLGEGTGGTRQLSITNNSNQLRTYTLSHLRALSTFGSTFTPSLTTSGASAVFSQGGVTVTSVAVAAGATAVVDVTITTPTLVNGLVYGGYLQIVDGGRTYRVPYSGFWGDYQLIQVLAPGGCSFPGIFKVGGQTTCSAGLLPGLTRQLDGAAYYVEDRNDRPVLLYHLAHQSRALEIRVVNDVTGETHSVASGEFFSRNASNTVAPGSFFGYFWDGKRQFTNGAGKVQRKAVPAGLYRLQLVVSKALADPANPAHVETWTSGVLSIVR